MSAVVIAATDLIPSLRHLLGDEGEIHAFSDTEPIKALQGILEKRPGLIVLERHFAATSRGVALLHRIKSDPDLVHADVRVMSHTGDYTHEVAARTAASRVAPGLAEGRSSSSSPSVATTEAAGPLDWRGTRRVLRTRLRSGVEIQLDGSPCAVVDLSPLGVQVVSSAILKPNQRVRVSIPNNDVVMRFRGAVIWAKFELPKPTLSPVYRAGVEFIDADPSALSDYCARNRQ